MVIFTAFIARPFPEKLRGQKSRVLYSCLQFLQEDVEFSHVKDMKKLEQFSYCYKMVRLVHFIYLFKCLDTGHIFHFGSLIKILDLLSHI